jgi:hypothetical protein
VVLGLGGVHAPVFLSVEVGWEAIGRDSPGRELPAPALDDLDLLVDVGRVERPWLHVVDAAGEAARGHVLLPRACPDEPLTFARGDNSVVAVGGDGLVGDGHEHDGIGVRFASIHMACFVAPHVARFAAPVVAHLAALEAARFAPHVVLRVAEREHAVLREREVPHARPAARPPAARLLIIPVVVTLHHEVA